MLGSVPAEVVANAICNVLSCRPPGTPTTSRAMTSVMEVKPGT